MTTHALLPILFNLLDKRMREWVRIEEDGSMTPHLTVKLHQTNSNQSSPRNTWQAWIEELNHPVGCLWDRWSDWVWWVPDEGHKTQEVGFLSFREVRESGLNSNRSRRKVLIDLVWWLRTGFGSTVSKRRKKIIKNHQKNHQEKKV